MFGIDLDLSRVGYALVTLCVVAGAVIAGVIWAFIRWLKGPLPIVLLLIISGCASSLPTLSQQLKKPATVEETINFTDNGIMGLLEEQYQQWGGKSVRSQWATVVGPITLDAVVTAMHLAASRGASSSSLVSGSLIVNFFRRVFLGIDPEARLRAYNGGLKLLREAEFAYLTAVATRHRGRIPNNRITAAGAQLLGAILKAQDKVEDVILGIVAKDPDSVSVQQTIEELIDTAIQREKREAAEEGAEEASRKLAEKKAREKQNAELKDPPNARDMATSSPPLIPPPVMEPLPNQ